MLRIGDKVRPTKEWYRFNYESNSIYPASMEYAIINQLPPSEEEIEKARSIDLGIVEGVEKDGSEIKISIKWIMENNNSRFFLHDAWWKEKDLEVISKNNVYSK